MILDPPDHNELDDDENNDDAAAPATKKKAGGAVNVLGAAMLAIGDILEPEKTDVEIVQADDDDDRIDDLPFKIDFGDLPPLE
ncbi:MAG: hypothetical protein ACR2PK_01540 [Acidimicrobiales bacterium]